MTAKLAELSPTPQEAAAKFVDALHEIGRTIATAVAAGVDDFEVLNHARDNCARLWGVSQLQAANIVRLANQVYAAKSHNIAMYSPAELQIIFAKAFSGH
jgi:hypothetical protein